SLGTTTIEIKTGYGQDAESEFKMAEVIAKLSREHPMEVVGTFLGMHALPPEFKGRREEFVRLVCEEMLPAMADGGCVTSCDAFIEDGAFTADEARMLARAAEAEDLPLRLHVDQFHDGGGAALAAELCALSADHLDFTSEEGMRAMAGAGVVAVCLPGASFFAGKGRYPDARRMIDLGCTVAVSTDYNPGTNPSLDLFLAASIAVARAGMTCEEALAAITKNAAAALALSVSRSLQRARRYSVWQMPSAARSLCLK
ncbi:MAG TPA: amidohydrolase family protein, partial [bacterium]|nr:amidohydrolase family protein [bacterium]